jgi:hypothetical protein
MSQPITSWSPSIGALDARSHLIQLSAERALALREGLGGVAAYMADLDAEIEHRRQLYVAAAVTETATLRAELFGAQTG